MREGRTHPCLTWKAPLSFTRTYLHAQPASRSACLSFSTTWLSSFFLFTNFFSLRSLLSHRPRFVVGGLQQGPEYMAATMLTRALGTTVRLCGRAAVSVLAEPKIHGGIR